MMPVKNSEIYGADIDSQILFKDERISTYYVDQTKERSLKKLFKLIGNNFDLIIDDGLHSHTANLNVIINCLKFLNKERWPSGLRRTLGKRV